MAYEFILSEVEPPVGVADRALQLAGALRQAPVSARAASLPHTG